MLTVSVRLGVGVVRITAVRLFRVEGRGPAWTFENRAVEQLDLYPDHERATAGAGDVGHRSRRGT